MSKEQELIECVKLLLWELENGYPKESKEEINQRIERIKQLNAMEKMVRIKMLEKKSKNKEDESNN